MRGCECETELFEGLWGDVLGHHAVKLTSEFHGAILVAQVQHLQRAIFQALDIT